MQRHHQNEMLIEECQHKLLDKLNLDGLSQWSPHNAATVRELLLSYHDVFTLGPNKLGCTNAIEHEIHITDDEPFKECILGTYLHHCLKRFVLHSEIC